MTKKSFISILKYYYEISEYIHELYSIGFDISDNPKFPIQNLVFILWGRFAHEKELLIDANKHLILKAAHPSPFSAYQGFMGCKHFSKTNAYLQSCNLKTIDWQIMSV
jgi:hypothetical protein